MKKKVVILHPAYWEQAMGGAELQISYLAKELKKRDYEVHFIYENKGVLIQNTLELQLHPLRKINIKKFFGQRWFLYRNEILKKLSEIEPDVIYTRFYSSWSGIAAGFAQRNNCKHIWSVASDSDLCRPGQKVSILKPFDLIENKYMREVFSKTTYILTQNDYQQNTLQSLYNRKSIKINQLTESVDEKSIIKNNDTIKILWIANFKPLKRPKLFVDLVNRYCNVLGIEFIMIGRNHEKYTTLLNNCSRKCENFQYLGEISSEEVNKELLKSHILVNTSEYEGFSNTFVQAWMRKVIVLSMNSNPDEIITNEEIGFICPSIDDLEEKINLLLYDEKLRCSMSEKAYHYAVENHSLQKNIGTIISLIH